MFKVVILVEVPSEEAAFVECLLYGLQDDGKISRFKEVSDPSETWEYLNRARLVALEDVRDGK